jgi:hypothetical protein
MQTKIWGTVCMLCFQLSCVMIVAARPLSVIDDKSSVDVSLLSLSNHSFALLPSVQAIAALKEGNDADALMALAKLSALLESLPVLEPDSTNVELIADELEGWADPALRSRVLEIACHVDPKKRPVLAAMVGLAEAAGQQQQPATES